MNPLLNRLYISEIGRKGNERAWGHGRGRVPAPLPPVYVSKLLQRRDFPSRAKFRERLLAGSAGTASCRLVGTCLPFYAYCGRLSLTLLTETRDDKKCPADSESSDTCRPQTVSAATFADQVIEWSPHAHLFDFPGGLLGHRVSHHW